MNNDRKNYVDNFNDKYRARLTKENLDFKAQPIGNRTFYA